MLILPSKITIYIYMYPNVMFCLGFLNVCSRHRATTTLICSALLSPSWFCFHRISNLALLHSYRKCHIDSWLDFPIRMLMLIDFPKHAHVALAVGKCHQKKVYIPTQMLHVCHIYLQNSAMFGVNVGNYSIHGACGTSKKTEKPPNLTTLPSGNDYIT